MKTVFLLHGIRDSGKWITEYKKVFTNNNDNAIAAISKHIGWISPLDFLFPGQVYADNELDILSILERMKGHEVTVVAHSYGAWFISHLLLRHSEVHIKNLIMCNSVVPKNFKWSEMDNVETILSICGNRDIWPCMAEIASSRFGATGSVGCQTPEVTDLYFDINHGGSLSAKFCREHILPFVAEGKTPDDDGRNSSWIVSFLQYINANRILVILAIFLGIIVYSAAPPSISCLLFSCYVDITRTDDFRHSQQDGGPRSYVRDIQQLYAFNYEPGNVSLTLTKASGCHMVDGREVLEGNLVNAVVYDVLTNPAQALHPVDKKNCKYEYNIPTKNKSALLRILFTSSSEYPAGGGISVPYLVRNLTWNIAPASGTMVEIPRDQIYGRLNSKDGKLIEDSSALRNCNPIYPPSTNPTGNFTLDCQDLWLIPEGVGYYPSLAPFQVRHEGHAFKFCFRLFNWGSKITTPSGIECRLAN